MSCIYRIESDEFGTYDVLEDEALGLRARLRRIGAELVSLARKGADEGWRGFLYRDNETGPPLSGWGNHATVMGYFLHRLVDQRSLYRGVEIRGGNHGFLRSFAFDPPTFDPNLRGLTYVVPADRIPAGAYPLRVSLQLSYQLTATGVRVEFAFRNEEPAETAHVSFGLHPGFGVTSVADAVIDLPPGRYRRHFAPGNFLDGRTEDIAHAGGPMPFDKAALPGSFLLELAGVPDRIFSLHDPATGRTVRLDFAEVPYCTLWSEGDFVCIEPCWGLPDSVPQKPFEQKDGIQTIAPGSTLRAGFGMDIELAPAP